MPDKREIYARLGIASKGLVYILIGSLTCITSFGLRSQNAGSKESLAFVRNQPLGKVVLMLITIGLLGYVFWRIYQAFEKKNLGGSTFHNLLMRVSFFISGVFYAILAYSSIKIAFNVNSTTSIQSIIAAILDKSFGVVLVVLIGLAIVAKAAYQIFKVWSGKYKNDLDDTKLESSTKSKLLYLGIIGYTLRGVVIFVIAYLILKSAWLANSSPSGGTQKAFSFIQEEFGHVTLVTLSIGLAIFGFFKLIEARYNSLEI